MNHIKNIIELCTLNIFIFLFRLIPIKTSYLIIKYIAIFIYYIIPIRKRTAYENIKQSLKFKDEKYIYKIIKQMYINFGYFLIDSIIMEKLKSNLNNNTTIYNIEFLKNALNKKNGVILYTAHIGNWHIMGERLVQHGFTINNLVKKQRNPYIFDKEVQAMKKSGMKVTVLQKTPKNIFKALKDNDVVEFLADQDAGENGIFIDFFGTKASTATGPALFAIKMNAPIIFAIDIRDENDPLKHTIHIETIEYALTNNINHDVYTLTEILTKKLEKYIIAYPSQYFWLHKRWRTRPKS